MDKIHLSTGVSINCKAISKEEYNGLLVNGSATPIKRYLDEYALEVYVLSDKKVVVKEGGYYTLYYGIDDLEAVLIDASNSPMVQEILFNQNPYGMEFPTKTHLLIDGLLGSLKINSKVINEELLKQVDEKLDSMSNVDFQKRHLLGLIALLGEVLIKKHNAKWLMKLASDNVTYNPYLIVNGKKVQFFTYLFEDIFIKSHPPKLLLTEIYQTVNEIGS